MKTWKSSLTLNKNAKKYVLKDIENIGKNLVKKFPKGKFILAGSLAYDEGNVEVKNNKAYYKSDVDIFVILPFFSFVRAIFFNKKKFIKSCNLVVEKADIFFVWKPLLKLKMHAIAGKDLKTGKRFFSGMSKKVRKEIYFNGMKRAYLNLILATKENQTEHLANSTVYAIRAKMIEEATNDDIFSLKQSRIWLKRQKYFDKNTTKVFDNGLKYKLTGEKFVWNKKDLEEIKHGIDTLFLSSKFPFLSQFNVQYYFYMLKKGNFPSIFVNFCKQLLLSLQAYATASLTNESREYKRADRLFKKIVNENPSPQLLKEISLYNVFKR